MNTFSKIINFSDRTTPNGFSELLNIHFDLTSMESYGLSGYKDTILPFLSYDSDHVLVTARDKKHIKWRELGEFQILDGIFSEGDYVNSFYVVKNIYIDEKTNETVRLVSLLYDEKGKIHIWTPAFEELFLPLIIDDLNNETDSHWKSMLEIHQRRSLDLNVYDIVQRNNVDYELEGVDGLSFNTTVFYLLMNHIFLFEDTKYPNIPGSNRTLKAYKDLYDDYLGKCVDMDKWRRNQYLKDPSVK